MKTITYYIKFFSITVLLLVCGLFSCRSSVTPEPPPPLKITAMEVTREYEGDRLEVEVHIYDTYLSKFIACSGQYHGLEHVDSSDYFFYTDAQFVKTETRNLETLLYKDIWDREIQIWVTEDDMNRCPEGIDHGHDDVIGISPRMDGRDLKYMTTLSFENVVHLRIGAYNR